MGLDLSIRAYPGGRPLRDAAHAALLERLHRRVHRSLGWATEVPLPITGDLRAWDALIRGEDWRCGVEAETRPRDLQALERRLTLKLRDGGVDWLVLLLLDSRHNRALVREHGEQLATAVPAPRSAGARAARGGRGAGRELADPALTGGAAGRRAPAAHSCSRHASDAERRASISCSCRTRSTCSGAWADGNSQPACGRPHASGTRVARTVRNVRRPHARVRERAPDARP